MAYGTRQNNTFEEQLPKLLQQLTQMKMAEDADFQWIIGLETQVIEKIQEPFNQAAQMTAGPQPGSQVGVGNGPMMAGPPPMGPGGPPTPDMSRGPMAGTPMPPIDELQRMIAGPSAS